jgi:hypothetical protein
MLVNVYDLQDAAALKAGVEIDMDGYPYTVRFWVLKFKSCQCYHCGLLGNISALFKQQTCCYWQGGSSLYEIGQCPVRVNEPQRSVLFVKRMTT